MNGIGITATMPFLLLRDRRVSGEAKLWWFVIASQQASAVKRVEGGVTRSFRTFAPDAVGTNERLPFAPTSRAICIYMQRPRRDETLIVSPSFDAASLSEDCRRWAERNRTQIKDVRLDLPDAVSMDMRQANCWFPMLVVGQLCGQKWASYATDAARKLCAEAHRESPVTDGVALLRDIRGVWINGRIFAQDLARRLCMIDDAPWHDRALTANKLSIQLKAFRIHSQQIRIGQKTAKGYYRGHFEDVWSRYL